MFTGVCLSTGSAPGGGVWSWGGDCMGGAWSSGVPAWGVPGTGEVCLLWGGAWSRSVPGPRGVSTRHLATATAAGSTHPTGMHSCVLGS